MGVLTGDVDGSWAALNLTQYGVYMTLALKAQAQSRATISALVDLKYPKQAATFVKQANMTTGPQQVNNGAFPDKYAQAHASAGDFETAPNKLLEESKDEVATCRDRYEYAGQNRTLVQHA